MKRDCVFISPHQCVRGVSTLNVSRSEPRPEPTSSLLSPYPLVSYRLIKFDDLKSTYADRVSSKRGDFDF